MGRIPWNKGKKLSDEHKRKIGLGNKGKTISKKQRAQISNTLKGNVPTIEARTNISIALKKWAKTPQGKKHYEKMGRLGHTPEVEEKRSTSLRRAFEEGRHPLMSPENRMKALKATVKRSRESAKNGTHPFQDPDVREKAKKASMKTHRKKLENGEHPFQDPNVRIKARKNCSISNYGGTWIEKKTGWLLNEMGLESEAQKPIPNGVNSLGRAKHLFPDFVLPRYNLIIECDGKYWHQDKNLQRQRDAVFLGQGYKVLHLTGKEIREDLDGCRIKIEDLINN